MVWEVCGWGEEFILLEELVEFNPKIQILVGKEVTYVEMKDLSESGMNVTGFAKRNFSAGSKFQLDDTILARITPCLENGKQHLLTSWKSKKRHSDQQSLLPCERKRG